MDKPNTKNTTPNVFIIESLDFEDEDRNLFEGQVISGMLSVAELEHRYHYVRTKPEFEHFLREFQKSGYRYLHISCHGKKDFIRTTLDIINFNELGLMLQPYLDKRRLFISACSAARSSLADRIFPLTECYSLIGPCKPVNIDDAAIFWASFYHLMFKIDSKKMKRGNIRSTLEKLAAIHELPIKFFIESQAKKGWKEVILRTNS